MATQRWIRGERRRASGMGAALAWSFVLSAALVTLATLALPGFAAARGNSGVTLTFTPQSGAPGTQVTVTIIANPPGPTPYLLSASPTNPGVNSCASGVTLSDAPKIIVMAGQPTTTSFTWPSELASGAYYLCAGPVSSQQGPVVWSQQPFIATGGSASVPPSPGVEADVQGGVIAAGGNFTLTVDATALAGDSPQFLTLIQPGQPDAVQLNWMETVQNGGGYTFDVTVPANTLPGIYAVRVLGGGGQVATSNSFQVVSDAVVQPGGGPQLSSQPLPISVPGSSSTSPASTLLVALVVLLLALAVACLVVPALRRRQ